METETAYIIYIQYVGRYIISGNSVIKYKHNSHVCYSFHCCSWNKGNLHDLVTQRYLAHIHTYHHSTVHAGMLYAQFAYQM